MKIFSCEAINFGSYRHLYAGLNNIGLSLVYGKTGAGKSTLLDIIAWTLFGITSKDGAADDVRSWQAPDAITEAEVVVQVKGATLIVKRVRAARKNDLFWHEVSSESFIRGKDLTETQKLLEQRLGVTAELFVAASYYHEFSPTGAFFTAKAKDRRELFDKLASLELPNKLADRASYERRVAKLAQANQEIQCAKLEGQYDQTYLSKSNAQLQAQYWESSRESRLEDIRNHADDFEADRERKKVAIKIRSDNFEAAKQDKIDKIVARLESITVYPIDYYDQKLSALELKYPISGENCPICGQAKDCSDQLLEFNANKNKVLSAIRQNDALAAEQNSLMDRLEAHESEQNNFYDQLDLISRMKNPHLLQLKSEEDMPNPFIIQLDDLDNDLNRQKDQLVAAKSLLDELGAKISDFDTLYDLSSALRGKLLRNAVKRIQDETNGYLETYFDSEIKVGFELDGADNLTVALQKSGYDCNYKQLSKGQRGLLKLCFSVAVMSAASDRAGIHFENLFFDESLDGLDSDLKVKAFKLFQSLENNHSSILLIDHAPEFHNLFARKYAVKLEGDYSEIEVQE